MVCTPIVVEEIGPEAILVVTGLTADPPSVPFGGSTTITVTVTNQGNVPAYGAGQITLNGTPIGGWETPLIPPGESWSFSETISLEGYAVGTHQLCAEQITAFPGS